MTNTPSTRDFILGSALAMTTMTVWAGWNIVSRLGTTDALSAYDIVFLRFLVAGLLAMPLFIRYLPYFKTIPVHFSLIMIAGSGAPYVLLASYGFEDAPASHGTLIPGFMLLCVALLSWLWLKERFNPLRIVGYALIAVTVLYRLISHSDGLAYFYADLFFLLAGVFWACYTVVNKHTGISPLQALALVSVGSFVGFCVPYGAMNFEHLQTLPPGPSITQMMYQGIIVSFVAFFCYNRAIGLIGPSRASAYAAAIPILTVLLAMPILGEFPTADDWWFVGLLTVGVLFSTGAMRRVLSLKER